MHVYLINEDVSVFFSARNKFIHVREPRCGRNEEISFHDIDPRGERSTLEGVAG